VTYWTSNAVNWKAPTAALEVAFDYVELAFEVRRRRPSGYGECIALRPTLQTAAGYAEALSRVRGVPVYFDPELAFAGPSGEHAVEVSLHAPA